MARNEGYDSNEALISVLTKIFIVLGILVMLSSFLKMPFAEQRDIIGLGVGIIAIGVGFLGGWIAIRSDNKMKAIANLEFDEKAAMIEQYEAYFRQNFDKTQFERFRWDLEAIAHVAKWADKDKRTRVSDSANVIATAINTHVTKDSLDRIKKLASHIKG